VGGSVLKDEFSYEKAEKMVYDYLCDPTEFTLL
jgi:hypothetical protein